MIHQIHKIVADYFDLEKYELFYKSRKKRFVYPRQIFFYFTRRYTDLKFREISEYSYGIHYTTIIKNIKKVENFIETEKEYRKIIEELNDKIKAEFDYNLQIEYNTEKEKEISFFKKLNKKLSYMLKKISIF